MASTSGVLVVTALVIVVMFLQFETCNCGFVSDEEILRSDLLSNFSVDVRPYNKTQISTLIYISSLNHLNIALQSMSINMVLTVFWHDYRLAWNSTAYGGINSMVAAPEAIWTPPLVIENAVENVGVIGGQGRDATPVRITSDGTVAWYPPAVVSTSCEMMIARYPFDTQSCEVVLVGWTYPLSEMDVTANGIDTVTMYSVHGEFDLKETSTYYSDIMPQNTSGDENTYRKLHYKFTFRRKWQFYGQNLLMPIVLNSILMNAVFALPIDSGEKMGYCLTVLLSYVVFLTWVTENLPPVSTDTSILQVYLAVVLCLGCLATLLTTWVLNLYHTSPEKPMGQHYRKFATTMLVPFSNFINCNKKKQDDAHGDESGRPQHVTKVTPMPPGPVTEMSRKLPLEHSFMGDVKLVVANGKDSFGSDEIEEEKTPTYTWQELASLFDCFFLWLFGGILVVLTTVIMSLLYADY